MNKYTRRIFNEGIEQGKRIYAREIAMKQGLIFMIIGVALGILIGKII